MDLKTCIEKEGMTNMRQRTIKTPMPEKQSPVKQFNKAPLSEGNMDTQEKLNKALVTASVRGTLAEVKGLVEKGADPNWENHVGLKAIDYAKTYEYYKIIAFLEKEMAKQ